MATQCQLNQPMRAALVDWLVEVVEESEIEFTTLALAVYLDRYLSSLNEPIQRNRFQLLGVTALSLAAKYYSSFFLSACCHHAPLARLLPFSGAHHTTKQGTLTACPLETTSHIQLQVV